MFGGLGRAFGFGGGNKPQNQRGMGQSPAMQQQGGGGMFGPSSGFGGSKFGNMASRIGGGMAAMSRPPLGPQSPSAFNPGIGGPSQDIMARFGSMVPGGGFAGGMNRQQQMPQQMPQPMDQGMDPNAGGGMFGPSQPMQFGGFKRFGGY